MPPNSCAQRLPAGGVDVRLGLRAERVSRDNGVVQAVLSSGSTVTGDEILVAVGRRPRTDDLGLESVGLRPGTFVEVDDHLRVPGLPWLCVIGDANGRALFTHMGKYQAHVLSEVLAGHRTAWIGHLDGAPRVVFTDPQIAAVGPTLQQAIDAGLVARAYDVNTSGTAGARFQGQGVPGTSRIVVDERRGVIAGATFVGAEVAEWLHAATVAVVGEVPIERLWQAVPAFPTRSEIWLKLLEQREAAVPGRSQNRFGEELAHFHGAERRKTASDGSV